MFLEVRVRRGSRRNLVPGAQHDGVVSSRGTVREGYLVAGDRFDPAAVDLDRAVFHQRVKLVADDDATVEGRPVGCMP